MNYGFKAANAVKADYKGKPAENIIALQADKAKGTYQLFANGKKVLTIDAATLGGYRFISEITGLDTVSLGATKRGGSNKYTFGGNIHKIEVYETPWTDEELIEETKKTAYPELQQIFHKNDGTGSNYYRIPALLTLKSGTVISAADARFEVRTIHRIILISQWQEVKMEERTGASRNFCSTMGITKIIHWKFR